MSRYNRLVLAITGASGVVYAKSLFLSLIKTNNEIHIIASRNAIGMFKAELNLSMSFFKRQKVIVYKNDKMDYAIASGSFKTDGMIIVPASMGTIGRITSGISCDLITRAADVTIKEHRRLIIVPRETPLSIIHLENLLKLAKMGANIIPASPGFYHNPSSIEDLVNFITARILDHLNIPQDIIHEWGKVD